MKQVEVDVLTFGKWAIEEARHCRFREASVFCALTHTLSSLIDFDRDLQKRLELLSLCPTPLISFCPCIGEPFKESDIEVTTAAGASLFRDWLLSAFIRAGQDLIRDGQMLEAERFFGKLLQRYLSTNGDRPNN